jgi:MFS family permease
MRTLPTVELFTNRMPNAFPLWRHRAFMLFVLARFLATVSIQMQSVAVGWQVYALSGDPLDLGLVGLAQFAPFIPAALIAGQVADRYDRRRIIGFCFLVELLCSLLLLAFTLRPPGGVWPVFAIMALYGTARAFMMPASQAVVINLVPETSFRRALALNSTAFQVAVIAGPALGGLLYVQGAAVVHATVASLLGVSALLMLATGRSNAGAAKTPNPATGGQSGLLDGLRHVLARRTMLGAISLDLFAVLFGGATALLPAIARDILQVGPTGLGLLRSAPGLGAAVTALMLSVWPIRRAVGSWMFGGVMLFGAASIVLGLSRDYYLSLAALALMGMGDMLSVFVRHLLVQLETLDAIRGRVSAVNAVFIGASNELGEFESGLAAAWLGLVPAVVVGGCATVLVTTIWWLMFPELRRLQEFPRAADERQHAVSPTPGG